MCVEGDKAGAEALSIRMKLTETVNEMNIRKRQKSEIYGIILRQKGAI